MLESPAFLALSHKAKIALIYLAKRYNGRNNGKIGFGVRSGCFVAQNGKLKDVSIGIDKSSMARCLQELSALGFIRCIVEATFDQKRLTREWRLTWLPCDEQPPTKEFMRWSAKLQNPVPMEGLATTA